MDFQNVNLLNVRLNKFSGNLLPMTADDSFSIFWKIYSLFIWLLEIVQFVALILGGISLPTEKVLKDGMIAIAITLEVGFIVTRIHWCRKSLQLLIRKLNDVMRSEDEMMRSIVKDTLKSVDVPLKCSWFAGVISIILWNITPYFLIFQRSSFFYMDYRMPVVFGKEPISTSIFLVGCLMATFSGAYIFTKKIAVDVYMIHLVLLVTSQYRYLASKLSATVQEISMQESHNDFNEEKYSRNIDQYTEQQIKSLCRHHNALVEGTIRIVLKVKNIEELKESIRKCICNIFVAMLDNVFQSFRKRLQFSIDSDGQHFENICY